MTVMVVLRNMGGRLICVSDEDAQNLINQGFKTVTESESRAYYQQQEEKLRSMERAQNKNGIYFATVTLGGADGYGSSSANIARELKKNGLSVSTSYEGQDICLMYHNPYSLLRVQSPYKILYTMFESTKLPEDWKPYLEAADEIWTPSKFCQKLFEDAGFKAEVVPLGYDNMVFTAKEREDKEAKHEEFVFLHYDAFNLRKGFLEVFEAFRREFDPNEPVRMIFKSSRKNRPDMSPVGIPILPEMYPNITCIFDPWTPQQLRDLCYMSDCFVFPSRGEGFGLTPLEAMATGIPAVVPNAHGIADYFDVNYMYESVVEGSIPAVTQRYKGVDIGNMVKVSIDELRKTLRWIYTHQDECRAKGVKAGEYAKGYTIEKTGKNIADRIKKIQEEGIKPKPLSNVLNVKII
jgi:glycosyltransferase involved in cell wall biosynthesis